MDFTPTQAQLTLATMTRQILTERAGPERLRQLDLQLQDGGDRFDPRLWDVLAETGVLGATLPQAVGGDGHGLLEQCSVLIELGRSLAPVPYLPTIAMAGSVLARFGTPQQQTEWLKPVLGGRMVLTVALTEPDGADALLPSTRAEPTPTGWSLTGTKTTVPAGPPAHAVLVSAATPDGPGLFAVTRHDAGVRTSRQRMIDHDDAGWLELSDVRLPADRLVGPVTSVDPKGSTASPGSTADSPVGWVLWHGTVALCAHQLGVLERALELTAEYATNRNQFDRPIGTFQAVAQRLADAYIQVEALRLTTWNAAWLLDSGQSSGQSSGQGSGQSEADPPTAETVLSAVTTAKFWAAEAGHHVAHTAVHVHGGAGIDVEHPVHRYFLAAKRGEFELGGATAQLLRLGAVLARD